MEGPCNMQNLLRKLFVKASLWKSLDPIWKLPLLLARSSWGSLGLIQKCWHTEWMYDKMIYFTCYFIYTSFGCQRVFLELFYGNTNNYFFSYAKSDKYKRTKKQIFLAKITNSGYSHKVGKEKIVLYFQNTWKNSFSIF